MKNGVVFLIVFVTAIVGYILYFVIGISSTFPPIKEYKFDVSKVDFEQKLINRINDSQGWYFEESDSIKGINSEDCYWASLFFKRNEQHLEYIIKYCGDSHALKNSERCLSLYVIGALDYANKSGGYKLKDKDVENLIEHLDRALLYELVPSCRLH